MDYQYLKIEKKDNGICWVTLNRPEKLNAIDTNSWREIDAFIDQADEDDGIRVIILTGAGDKAFAAGADLNALYQKTSAECIKRNVAQRALSKVEACTKPIIAAVNGFAFGGGCEVTLACDFRIVTPSAKFGLPEAGLGIIPGAGGTQRLCRLIGMGRAKDMIMLDRKVGGEEAVQIGLASMCVPQEELTASAEKMAAKLLSKAPLSLAVSKRVIQNAMSSAIDVGMYTEQLALSALCGSEDKTEGVGSFLEKRTPEFKAK